MSSSIIPLKLVKRIQIGNVTNEDLYEISKHIACKRNVDGNLNNSDLAPLLLHLNTLIKDLKWRKKWRKRFRLIKQIFKHFKINDYEAFPFPVCKNDDFCISIPFKFSRSEMAKEELFKFLSLNNENDLICYFSNTISNLSEHDIEKIFIILTKNIRRNYKNSIWNLYYFLKKTNQSLLPYFSELIYLFRDILKQESNFTWQESKSYPDFKSKKGMLSLSCIDKLTSIVIDEDSFIEIATNLISNLSGTIWDKSVDLMIVNFLSKRLNCFDVSKICNFHNKVYSILSTHSSLPTHSIDLIGSIISSCLFKGSDCSGCKQLLDLLLNSTFNKVECAEKNVKGFKKNINAEKFGNISNSSIFAISAIPNKYVKKDIYEKIDSYLQHISSKPTYYFHEILLKGNNKILKDNFLVNEIDLERFNPIKLLYSSFLEFPFPSNLCEKIIEMRFSMNILKSIKKPTDLPFYKKWETIYDPAQFFALIGNILDGKDDVEANVNIHNSNNSNNNIDFYDVFLFNGELTSKGRRYLFETEKDSFLSSIRYLPPQLARSLALELVWEKGKYLNFSKVRSSPAVQFIDKILIEVMDLVPDPNFDNLCKILKMFSNPIRSDDNNLPTYDINECSKPLSLLLNTNELSEIIIKYCESDHKLDNPFIRFLLSLIPTNQGNDIIPFIIGYCFKIISDLSTLTDDDIALFLSDDKEIFVPSGIYLDKSTLVGEKREKLLQEQLQVRKLIGDTVLKVEKYFFALENAISTAITGDVVDNLLKLLKGSLVIPLLKKCSTSLLTRLVKTIISIESDLPNSAWNCIVDAYLEIYSKSGNDVTIPKSIDKFLTSISNKRISRPLASLLLPIPLEKLKLLKPNSNGRINDNSDEITSALSVLSSQLRQRLDLPVSKILSTLCQITYEMGDAPNSTVLECIIELAYYPMDQECIENLSNYILSPSSHLRYALSQMISKRRDFLPQLYKYLKILVHDSGPASLPSRNVTIFYRQSKKVSPLDPSVILDIDYDESLKEVMPEMVGKTLAMTYFEGDSTFSELILIITAKYISSPPKTRIAILQTISHLFKNGKQKKPNEKYNPSDVEVILKFLVTVVLQQARNTAIDELQISSISNTFIINNALSTMETIAFSEKNDVKSFNDIVEKLSVVPRDSAGIAPMIITRSCNLLKAMIIARDKSTKNSFASLNQLINSFLSDRHEIENAWILFFSKTIAKISFEDKQAPVNLFNTCFNRMNNLVRGEKLEQIINKSTLVAASISLSMDPNDVPASQIIDYMFNNNREERLRSLQFIINLYKVNEFIGGEDIILRFFDNDLRSRIVEGLFPLMSDSYIPVKNSAIELSNIMSMYDTIRLFETISTAIFSPDSTSKTRLGAIKFANSLGKSIKNLDNFPNIDFLVEACLDSNCEVRSAAIHCVEDVIDNLKIKSFQINEYKNALTLPSDNNLQKFLQGIQSVDGLPFSLVQPILKRSIKSRSRPVRILTLNYLLKCKLSSIDSFPFYPLVDLNEEEVELMADVMGGIKDLIKYSDSGIISLYMESAVSKSSPFERYCYSKILSRITDYSDVRDWSFSILTLNSPYYKIHGILMLFINLDPLIFSNELNKLLNIAANLLNHETDIVREASFELFEKLIHSLPNQTQLFIDVLTSIFKNFSPKAASSRDLALSLVPQILKLNGEEISYSRADFSNNKDVLYLNVYLMKFDASPTVRETAEHIWRRIAPNTRRVLKKIILRLLDKLEEIIRGCNIAEPCMESIIALEVDVVDTGDRLMNRVLDYLLENRYTRLLKIVIKSSKKSLLEGYLDKIGNVLKDGCSSEDSAISIEALGLLSKWVPTVMDDSLINLFELALADSESQSFKTLKTLSLDELKLIDAWKIAQKSFNDRVPDGFWPVADLVLSNALQNLSKFCSIFFKIMDMWKGNDITYIPVTKLLWNFGIRGPEFIIENRNEFRPVVFKSLIKSLIESTPSKTLVIELAPLIISTVMLDAKILQSIFESSDLPQHQGILLILIAQALKEYNGHLAADVSHFLIPALLSYLTSLTASNPVSLGLAFNSQVAYSISCIVMNSNYKFIQQSALRLSGLLIRAAGDWSHLLCKASLLASLYHLVKLINAEQSTATALRPIIPQLMGLSIKSLGMAPDKEKVELPFNPSYPTFAVSSDPCSTFPSPQFIPLSLSQSTVILSPITLVRRSALALFQLIVPSYLDRFDLAFNELLKIVTPGCPPQALIAMEFLISLKNSGDQFTKFERLYEKSPENKLNPFYNRVIAAHIKSSNNLDSVVKLLNDIRSNPPLLESGMILAHLDPSLLLAHKDKLLDVYKTYVTYDNGHTSTIINCKTIAVNIFERALDPSFNGLGVKMMRLEVDFGCQTLAFLEAIEKLVSTCRKSVLEDYDALAVLLKLLGNCIFSEVSKKIQSERILRILLDGKPLRDCLPADKSIKQFASIKDVISKLDSLLQERGIF